MIVLSRTPVRLVPLLIFLFLVGGCDIVNTKDDENDNDVRSHVYIGNQGEFGAGNGTVTRYDPATNSATTAFRDLETIVQSIEIDGDLLFIVANTGGRVDVLNHKTGALVGQVEGLVSPRYLAMTDDKLFVTNLYGSVDSFTGGIVSVIDRATYQHLEDIEVGNNPDGIARVGNRVFVANQGFGAGRTVSVIDATSDEVITTTHVDCDGPRYVVPDSDGDVFVTCTGQTIYDENFNEIGTTDGEIVILNAVSGAVTGRLPVEGRMMSAEFGQDAYFDAESRRMYALSERDGAYFVLIIDTEDNVITGEVGPLDGSIGSVAYDAEEDVLYLGYINGFTQAGTMRVVDMDGELIRSFSAGIAPTSIRFADR